jgi:hypothetical protein
MMNSVPFSEKSSIRCEFALKVRGRVPLTKVGLTYGLCSSKAYLWPK